MRTAVAEGLDSTAAGLNGESCQRVFSPLVLHRLVVGLFERCARASIRYPWRALMIGVGCAFIMVPGLFRLGLRTDANALLDPLAPEVALNKSVQARFGVVDPIVVILRSTTPEGIFNPSTLQLVKKLTAGLSHLPSDSTAPVTSLATLPGLRMRTGTLEPELLLERDRTTLPECSELRDDLRRIQLYNGTLLALDGRSTAILVGVPGQTDRAAFYQSIRAFLQREVKLPNEFYITGAPVAESLLGVQILADLGVPARWLHGARSETEADFQKQRSDLGWRSMLQRIVGGIGLAPLSGLLMALVFQVSFRRATATVLPLLEVGACLVFVFGLMGWLGVPVYLTVAVMPVLLIAMAVTDEIHVYNRYFALLHEQPDLDRGERVWITMKEMICPVVNTSLTTAVGFLSFAFSPLQPVVAFGLFTSVGVLFCLFWSLSVMPALLTLVPPAWLRARRSSVHQGVTGKLGPMLGLLSERIVRHRRWALLLLGLWVVVLPTGLRMLKVQDSWVDNFAPDSEFYRATQLFNQQFHGMHRLQVSLDGEQKLTGSLETSEALSRTFTIPAPSVLHPEELVGRWFYLHPITASGTASPSPWQSMIVSASLAGKRCQITTEPRDFAAPNWASVTQAASLRYETITPAFLQPSVLQAVRGLAERVEKRRDLQVGKVLSAVDILSTERFLMHPEDPTSRQLPGTAIETKILWDTYRAVRGEQAAGEIVSANHAHSLVTVFMKNANFVDTERLMLDIRDYARDQLAPVGVRCEFAGDVAVSQSLIRGIVTTQTQSLVWSVLGIYAVTALLGRSLRWGLYCVAPCTLAVVLNFALMGWCGIHLGVATSMFAGMTLGIGVDFAIHLLEGYSSARNAGMSAESALKDSMTRTGPAVLINTVAIALGFGVLMFSPVPANAHLGLLTVMGIVNSLLASLILLPLLLHRWPMSPSLPSEDHKR